MISHVETMANAPSKSFADRYFVFLMVVLAGYAIGGRGFAYFGYPPLFVGEILVMAGVVALLKTGCGVAAFAAVPSALLAVTMAWVLARTLPYIPSHGFNALRDSVIVMYGAIAFIVVGLLVDRPERLRRLFDVYGKFAGIYVVVMMVLYPLSLLFYASVPAWPWSGAPIFGMRSGEVAVHVTGAALFAFLGFRRFNSLSLLALFLCFIMVAANSRGGMLAIILPVMLVFLLVPNTRQIGPLILIGFVIILTALVLDVELVILGDRKLSAQQILWNFISIVDSSDRLALDGTKQWRLMWWEKIVSYTFYGDYYWSGKGFGVNLADADGFQVNDLENGPLLRSPHNAHMTMLSRGGVPGLVLWTLTLGGWVVSMLRSYLVARRHGDRAWARLFVFLLGYWLSIVVNASFDVALESPMLGLWFWALYGVGIAATMIYWHERMNSGLHSE